MNPLIERMNTSRMKRKTTKVVEITNGGKTEAYTILPMGFTGRYVCSRMHSLPAGEAALEMLVVVEGHTQEFLDALATDDAIGLSPGDLADNILDISAACKLFAEIVSHTAEISEAHEAEAKAATEEALD